MDDFITVAVFTYPHEITVLKHRLQQEQITHFFENEAMTSIAPMYSLALGGIRLKVHPDDLVRTKTILDDLNYNSEMKIV